MSYTKPNDHNLDLLLDSIDSSMINLIFMSDWIISFIYFFHFITNVLYNVCLSNASDWLTAFLSMLPTRVLVGSFSFCFYLFHSLQTRRWSLFIIKWELSLNVWFQILKHQFFLGVQLGSTMLEQALFRYKICLVSRPFNSCFEIVKGLILHANFFQQFLSHIIIISKLLSLMQQDSVLLYVQHFIWGQTFFL